MTRLIGSTIYFNANDGINGNELWAHDISKSSTSQVADINSGSGGSNPGQYMEILVGDIIYMDADDGVTGCELWSFETIPTHSITYD